ncbi:flavin-containing monooxygenase [Streptomyces sudanensis]|uniref:flavin-containing monooxygenase n=1 Tax=Streptomyces sudanensis TaxID=436397 RepID=UPI00355820C7
MPPANKPSPTPPAPVLGPPVYVVGGGPGGLAAAAALRGRGVRAVVLEKSPAVAASWRRHYDRLRLHTTRRMSALPGLPMPRSFGRWVSRDDMVRYLEEYARRHGLEVVTGVEVVRIERAAPDGGDGDGGGGWVLHASGGRRLTTRAVVVATGAAHVPVLPAWPGREEWAGDLRHAAAYRSPAPYADKDVLVVGAGNSGAEIAVDLAEGGAARVRLAVRTAPHVVRRSVAGWSAQRTAVLLRRWPVWAADRLLRAVQRVTVPDLSAYGLPRPGTGPYARLRRDGSVPVHDTGLVDAVRRGRVEPVAAVTGFGEDGGVALADGSVVHPDAVIAATGYRGALEAWWATWAYWTRTAARAHGGARAAAEAPGLYFVGFARPLGGLLRELAAEARRVARAIAATPQPPGSLRGARRPRPGGEPRGPRSGRGGGRRVGGPPRRAPGCPSARRFPAGQPAALTAGRAARPGPRAEPAWARPAGPRATTSYPYGGGVPVRVRHRYRVGMDGVPVRGGGGRRSRTGGAGRAACPYGAAHPGPARTGAPCSGARTGFGVRQPEAPGAGGPWPGSRNPQSPPSAVRRPATGRAGDSQPPAEQPPAEGPQPTTSGQGPGAAGTARGTGAGRAPAPAVSGTGAGRAPASAVSGTAVRTTPPGSRRPNHADRTPPPGSRRPNHTDRTPPPRPAVRTTPTEPHRPGPPSGPRRPLVSPFLVFPHPDFPDGGAVFPEIRGGIRRKGMARCRKGTTGSGPH